MNNEFRLLMLGAMYENGGNTTHRFLDGHPELFVYPYESQIGTRHVQDMLSSAFPLKYRWPAFQLDASPLQDYKAIIDEEGKVRSRTPNVSKFRHMPFDMNDDERCEIYQKIVAKTGRSTANNVAAFYQATFSAWKDHQRSGRESVYVGYSPIITVDAERILRDMPTAHILHVVRNPWSAFADTSKRPVPMSLENYMLGWTLNQHYALLAQTKFPEHVHIVRAEDVMADSHGTLSRVLSKLGIGANDSLRRPSWNGKELEEVYPWGTIRKANSTANKATANELSQAQKDEIRIRTWQYLETFDYKSFV